MASRNLSARRKLSDLYRTGVEIRFGPGGYRIGRVPSKSEPDSFDEPPGDDEVAMWLAPPSPLQRQEALSEANGAKARALIKTRRDEESEEHLTSLAFLAEMSLETLIDYVLEADRDDRQAEAIRDVLRRDEWKEIQDLREALRQFDEAETPEEDEENAAVLERDKEYGNQVREQFEQLTQSTRESMRLTGRGDLERRALEKRSELVGAQRFVQAFERWMKYFAVRQVDARDKLFFDNPGELDEESDTVQDGITEALSLFIREGDEAKNLLGASFGSNSSTPPSAPETSDPSTPQAVSA